MAPRSSVSGALRRGRALALLAFLGIVHACLDDEPTAPAGAASIALRAQVVGAQGVRVHVRLLYQRLGDDGQPVDVLLDSLSVPTGQGTQPVRIAVDLAPCYADERRVVAGAICLLSAELTLLSDDRELDRTVIDGLEARPGAVLTPALVVLAAVGSVTPEPPPPSRLMEDDAVAVAVKVRDARGGDLPDRAVVWTSDNAAVATVTSDGEGAPSAVINAVAPGAAVIKATAGTGSAQIPIDVYPRPVSLEVTPSPLVVAVAATAVMQPVARDKRGEQIAAPEIAWASTDEGIATVSPSGVATGVAPGSTSLSATVGALSVSVPVTVTAAGCVVSPNPALVALGGSVQLSASVADANGNSLDVPVTWSLSTDAVGSVSSAGVLTGSAVGAATVTAAGGGVQCSARVEVRSDRLVIAPAAPVLDVGQTQQLRTENALGAPTWSSSDERVATVSAAGVLGARFPGRATITASTPGQGGTIPVVVNAASLTVAPSPATVEVDGTTTLVATARAVDDAQIPQVPITWVSETPARATVSPAGVVTGIAEGEGTIRATGGGRSATVRVTVTAASVETITVTPGRDVSAQVLAGNSIVLTARLRSRSGKPLAGRPVTWGAEIPDLVTLTPTTGTSNADGEHSVTITGRFAGATGIGASSGGKVDRASVHVTVVFATISAGAEHTCATTVDGDAYCWGANDDGQLGDGSNDASSAPRLVVGGMRFSSVSAGVSHTCAVTTDGRAFCWGRNDLGQLGTGATSAPQRFPVQVRIEVALNAVSVGDAHSCALSQERQTAFCWGNGENGRLGYGDVVGQPAPIEVFSGLFYVVSAGGQHSCGTVDIESPGGFPFCWGSNANGRLGFDTDGEDAPFPRQVFDAAGNGLEFQELDVSFAGGHSCGVLFVDGRVICWGRNESGQVGDGTTQDRPVATAVSTDLRFFGVSLGTSHTCAIDSSVLTVFCWGSNARGQLGTGDTFDRSTPQVAVVGPSGTLGLSRVSAGGVHTCGLGFDDRAFCWGGNQAGQLGIGTSADVDVAQPVLFSAPNPDQGGEGRARSRIARRSR